MRHVAIIVGCIALASACLALFIVSQREALVSLVFERAAYSSVGEWHDTPEGPLRDAELRNYFYRLTYQQQQFADGKIGASGGTMRVYSRDGNMGIAFVLMGVLVIVTYLLLLGGLRWLKG